MKPNPKPTPLRTPQEAAEARAQLEERIRTPRSRAVRATRKIRRIHARWLASGRSRSVGHKKQDESRI